MIPSGARFVCMETGGSGHIAGASLEQHFKKVTTMRTATAIGLGIALLLTTATRGQDTKTTTDAKANGFEGAYTITAGEDNGKPVPDEVIKGTILRITTESIVMADKEDKEIYVTKYVLDTKKSPAGITMTETGGPRGRKGEKARGIIKRDGDTVKICYCYEGGIVPTEFKTMVGEKQLCFTMKRKDKDKDAK